MTDGMPLSLLREQIEMRGFDPVTLKQPIKISELATPALVLDRGAFERNVARMTAHVARFDKGVRPHAKTHKCPVIAKYQLQHGAVGVCVAKLSEAVALVHAGVHSILITSPLTDSAKVQMLASLTEVAADLSIVLDSQLGLDLLKGLQPAQPLGVVLDLDVSMGRTGSRDDDLVARLLDGVHATPHLRFVGFQHYAGHVMHIEGHEARKSASLALWDKVCERVAPYQGQFEVLTGCGTGTYDIDVEIPQITDLQVGSYVFMDEEYRLIGSSTGERFDDFEVSLTVACTAISQPMDGAITLDGGYKAMASDTVPPAVDELVNAKYRFAGDEHGVLLSRESVQSLTLGDVVRVVSPHCDPTVNLHDYLWVLEEDGLIHACWPITGRGCTW